MAIKQAGYKDMLVRIEDENHKKLKKLSYLLDTPMNVLIRQAVNEKLNKDDKLLTNAQIVI